MLNCLRFICPELASEWHPTRNGDRTPDNVAFSSNKPVWWRCSKGHEWQKSPNARINRDHTKKQCPYCGNKLVWQGYNDLQTTDPELAKEWHPTKNGNILASQVMRGTGKKYWWLGVCGHEWMASPNNRTSLKAGRKTKYGGCPYCTSERLLPGFNDLQTCYPRIAAEWHPFKNGELKPNMIMASSSKMIWWQCKLGHEWLSLVCNRTGSHSNDCPVCGNKRVQIGFNDLLTTHPELASQWHPTKNGKLKPEHVTFGSGRKVWWLCPTCNKSWLATISSRVHGNGCPHCISGRQTSFPEQAIFYYLAQKIEAKSRFREYGKELDIWIPALHTGIEFNGAYYHRDEQKDRRKIAFFSEKGIKVITVREGDKNAISGDCIDMRTSANYYIRPKDLEWAISQLFGILDIEAPTISIKNDLEKIKELYTTETKANSLAAVFPKIAEEWDYAKNGKLLPEHFSFSSGFKANWKCRKCGSEWKATIDNRVKGRGCPVCGGKKVVVGINDLATTDPELAAQWHPTKNGIHKPTEYVAGSNKKAWWLCSVCGYEWEAMPNTRKRGSGCQVCSGKTVLSGVNDLRTTHPQIAAEWHPTKNGNLTPEMVSKGSEKKVWWKCSKCGYEWNTMIYHRSIGHGCPQCMSKKQRTDRINTYIKKRGSLAERYPDVSQEWHPERNGELTPSQVTSGSGRKVWWLCPKCNMPYEATVANVVKGHKCPYCSGRRFIPGIGDFGTTHPKEALEWHPTKNDDLTPQMVSKGSEKKVWWKCSKCGYEWQAIIYSRAAGHGCPMCGKRKSKNTIIS